MQLTITFFSQTCVIILDNASYHNVRAEKLPTSATCKADMENWLIQKGIPFQQNLLKVELCDIIKNNADFITYRIYDVIRNSGFEILRLPLYDSELKP